MRLMLAQVFSWRLVRTLGELQVLTKASYAMLIIVPLLAGLWPAVRLIVNQYDKSATEAAEIFERATTRFSEIERSLADLEAKTGLAKSSESRVATAASLGGLRRQVEKHRD